MNKPSSTITAATLAASALALIWMIVDHFSAINVPPGIISGSTALIAAIFGYFRKETVLK